VYVLNTSCKKATYLISKKEEHNLSWLDGIRLRSHLSICSLCRKFESQTNFIARMIKNTDADISLPPETKEKIQQALDNNREK
jgi:predicted anti-sigma-YlaC factor YlaD